MRFPIHKKYHQQPPIQWYTKGIGSLTTAGNRARDLRISETMLMPSGVQSQAAGTTFCTNDATLRNFFFQSAVCNLAASESYLSLTTYLNKTH